MKLMLVIGEIKISLLKPGLVTKSVLKHCPDYHFMMNDDLHARLYKRFTDALELSETLPETHLMMISTFHISIRCCILEELALINVTETGFPFENISDKTLIDALTQAQRSFVKGYVTTYPQVKPLTA